MGVEATVDDVVNKLEGFYGTVESGAVLLQQLYSEKQRVDETITTYSARLQLSIDRAEQRNGISPSAKDETLRVVFWKGLSNETLKQSIRHKYESVQNFDELVRIARQVEQESEDFQKFHSPSPRPRPSRVGMHASQVERPNKSALEKEVKELREKLQEIELASMNKGPSSFRSSGPNSHPQPFRERYRRVPPSLYAELREHLESMHQAGVTRESFSPYASPVVLVRKKDGSLRFCIDFRKLNQKTVRDSYALPRIDETLQMMQGATWFSSLDLKSGYWQLEINEADKHKTAFVLPPPLGLWECNRMPFGLCNAPSTFQRAMERCLGELNHSCCVVYLDDIIVFGRTVEEHIANLEKVIQRLDMHGFKLKATKCKLLQTGVKYLRHVLSAEGIATDPEKTETIRNWPTPQNVKELRAFLGLASYYRKFIPNLAKIASPLNALLGGPRKRKGKGKRKTPSPAALPPWVWAKKQDDAFREIKEKLVSPPVLQYADFSKPFILHTDASTTGLGAALYQLDEEGRERVIAYASRSVSRSEQNCPAHKLEFLALKWAVTEKFHDFLYGNKTHVFTDNNPLTYVLTTAKLDATGHRWLAALANYDLKLTYRSGKTNVDADILSRRPPTEHAQSEPRRSNGEAPVCEDTVHAVIDYALHVDVDDSPYAELVENSDDEREGMCTPDVSRVTFPNEPPDWPKEQRKDPVISKVITYVVSGALPPVGQRKREETEVQMLLREWDRLAMRDGILYRRRVVNDKQVWQLVLPRKYRQVVLESLHDETGHLGIERTTEETRPNNQRPSPKRRIPPVNENSENKTYDPVDDDVEENEVTAWNIPAVGIEEGASSGVDTVDFETPLEEETHEVSAIPDTPGIPKVTQVPDSPGQGVQETASLEEEDRQPRRSKRCPHPPSRLAYYHSQVMVECGVAGQGIPPEIDSIPADEEWSVRYTFSFTIVGNGFTKKIRIIPRTSKITLLSIPCLNETCQIDGERSLDIDVSQCTTVQLLLTDDVIVYGLVYAGDELTAGFLALPEQALGKEYLVDCLGVDGTLYIFITAIEDNTEISVNSSNEGDSPLILHLNASNFTRLKAVAGAHVSSNKKVAVIVEGEGVRIPINKYDRGVIMEQLFPISHWGRVHIVPKFAEDIKWTLQVMSFQPETNVSLTNCEQAGVQYVSLESRKNYTLFQVRGHQAPCVVVANKPIQVVQYMHGSALIMPGDPSMILIAPVENYHGNITLHIKDNTLRGETLEKLTSQHVDIITEQIYTDSVRLGNLSIAAQSWNCFNVTDGFQAASADENVRTFCHLYRQLSNDVYHVGSSDPSVRMFVRLSAHASSTGGAMLADISFPTAPEKTEEDVVDNPELELKNFLARHGDFQNYEDAERLLGYLLSYLGDKDELDSVENMNFTFDIFTEIMRRKPLQYATAANTQTFMNMTAAAVHVIFAERTNELMAIACSQEESLLSYPDDVQRELEAVAETAADKIASGGLSSFQALRPNAAIRLAATQPFVSVESEDNCANVNDVTSHVAIPCAVLREQGARALYHINLPYAGEAISRSTCTFNDSRIEVPSSLLGVGFVSDVRNESRFSQNISITFNLKSRRAKVNLTDDNTLCSFWNFTQRNWSSAGCKLDTRSMKMTEDVMQVTCLCDHLTSFAVLVNLAADTETPVVHEHVMSILSIIGCSFSIVACFIMCCGYVALRLKSDLILVHGNLAFALGLAEIAFLCLEFVRPPSVPCTVVATLIYYFFLVTFSWMTVEGIHLYLLTFVVWNAEKRKIGCYMACAWGLPIILVAVLLSTNDGTIGQENICFLSIDDLKLLYLVVPLGVVILFNLFVTIRVVFQIAKMASGPNLHTDNLTKIKHGAKALVVLLPIMGLTWVIGFMTVIRGASLVFQYIFLVLNSLQGVFIFVIHFLRNSEVRYAIRRRRDKWMTRHGKPLVYREKMRDKSSQSGQTPTSRNLSKTPEQTLTLTNLSS
ncbi:uncharacterized protein [Diadema antillarum]|uniref:uncharacterized protein n=1 Tax=Diadema antillarum TaxID=105358 RepID=UPI003A84C79D